MAGIQDNRSAPKIASARQRRSRWPQAVAIALVAVALAVPALSSATSRLERTRLAIPADFLNDETPPECARGLWSNDPQAILAIQQGVLLSCRRKVKSADTLRMDRERQIDNFRRILIAQQQRVSIDPDYPDRAADMEQVDKLLAIAECRGRMWQGYDAYMDGFVVEYRRMSSIVRVRTGNPLPSVVPVCQD